MAVLKFARGVFRKDDRKARVSYRLEIAHISSTYSKHAVILKFRSGGSWLLDKNITSNRYVHCKGDNSCFMYIWKVADEFPTCIQASPVYFFCVCVYLNLYLLFIITINPSLYVNNIIKYICIYYINDSILTQ